MYLTVKRTTAATATATATTQGRKHKPSSHLVQPFPSTSGEHVSLQGTWAGGGRKSELGI